MTNREDAVRALARSFGGWNDDTSEPNLEGPHREAMEAHWEKVNQQCLLQAEEHIQALETAGFRVLPYLDPAPMLCPCCGDRDTIAGADSMYGFDPRPEYVQERSRYEA